MNDKKLKEKLKKLMKYRMWDNYAYNKLLQEILEELVNRSITK